MSHTFTQLTTHIVFSTRDRRNLIAQDHESRIHGRLASVINNQFGFARIVGGTTNHVHILADLKPTVAIADRLRVIKSTTSGWVHDTFPAMASFAWQEGYGAFSVSASNIPQVKAYIENQHEHHHTLSFQDEFVRLLEKHGIEYDPQYLWK